MSSQNLRQRSKDEPSITAPTSTNNNMKNRGDNRMAMAKRGLRSLTIAVAVPLCLTMTTMFLFGSTRGYATIAKPFWQPPRWAFNLATLSTSSVMGLAAWLVWAEGGFRRQPGALPLYLGQLLLSLLWPALVFSMGAMKVGLFVCVLQFMVLLGCSQTFRKVNPVAGDLVKPCLAWASFLAVFNYKFV